MGRHSRPNLPLWKVGMVIWSPLQRRFEKVTKVQPPYRAYSEALDG
jgi:hypothetical protein